MDDTYYLLSEEKRPERCTWVIFDDRSDFLVDLRSSDSGVIFGKTYMATTAMLPPRVREAIAVKRTQLTADLVNEQDPELRKQLEDDLDSLKDEHPAALESLAESTGCARMIAALRMDADNMGKVLQQGFKQDATLEKVCFFSRNINYFFRLYLNTLCKQASQAGRNRAVHVIYAGGDDLFALGAWNDVAELSVLIGDAFKEYTCHNPDLGLSGGFTLHKPKFPVKDMAGSSLVALNTSKRNLEPCWFCLSDWANCPLLEGDGHCLRKDSLAPFFTEYRASIKSRLDEKFIKKHDPRPSRLKLAFKRSRYGEKWESPADEVKNFILRPLKVFMAKDVPQPPATFFHNALNALEVWYDSGELYLPIIAWLIQKQRDHLRSQIDKNTSFSMYDLYDWNLHMASPEMISALHVPITWAILSKRKGDETDEAGTD